MMNEVGILIGLAGITGALLWLVYEVYQLIAIIERLITTNSKVVDRMSFLEIDYRHNVAHMHTICSRMVDAQATFNEAARKLNNAQPIIPAPPVKPVAKPTKRAARK